MLGYYIRVPYFRKLPLPLPQPPLYCYHYPHHHHNYNNNYYYYYHIPQPSSTQGRPYKAKAVTSRTLASLQKCGV